MLGTFETLDEGLSMLDESKQVFFNVVDEQGNNVQYVNRIVVRNLIEAGNVFDLNNIPVSLVGDGRRKRYNVPFLALSKSLFGDVHDFSRFDLSEVNSRRER